MSDPIIDAFVNAYPTMNPFNPIVGMVLPAVLIVLDMVINPLGPRRKGPFDPEKVARYQRAVTIVIVTLLCGTLAAVVGLVHAIALVLAEVHR